MGQFLPFVMQNLLNTPLAMTPSHGDMVAAALSGRINIQALEDSFGQYRDRSSMIALAAQGRADADRERERKAVLGQDDIEWNHWGEKSFVQVGSIAIIKVWGSLTRTWGVGPYSGATGYDGILRQLIDANEDKTIKAIWLDIASGGGAINGLFDLCEVMWGMNATNGGGKPIFAMAADHAYSAAFAIATCADRIFCSRTGGVGSVGCIMMHADVSHAMEEAGIKVTIIRSADKKARGSEFEVLDADTKAHWQSQIDECADVFIDLVARNLGLAKKTVLETEALDYMGNHAKAIGFVDEVVSEPTAWHQLETLIEGI